MQSLKKIVVKGWNILKRSCGYFKEDYSTRFFFLAWQENRSP